MTVVQALATLWFGVWFGWSMHIALVRRRTRTRYIRMVEKLREARRIAGGRLPDDIEDMFICDLDVLWWCMSPADRDSLDTGAPRDWKAGS